MNSRYFFTTESWKKTAAGTAIALYSSRPLKELKGERPLLLMGGIHGDEPEGVALAEGALAWLKSECAADRGARLAPWVLIPCLNVDGFKKNQRVNARGVDLNRNYPASNWSAAAEKERYFPGPAPASEAEIQGVVELLLDLKPRLAIHCHSWNPMVIYAGSAGLRDAERLGRASGYKVVDSVGYPTPGSLSQYGWGDLKIPVICIEEQDGLADLSLVWPRFAAGVKEIFLDRSPR